MGCRLAGGGDGGGSREQETSGKWLQLSVTRRDIVPDAAHGKAISRVIPFLLVLSDPDCESAAPAADRHADVNALLWFAGLLGSCQVDDTCRLFLH